jgi:hypothetical protein
MTEIEQQQAGASAIAALILAQLAFWAQLDSGALAYPEAAEMLTQAIAASAKGGTVNQMAGQKLQTILDQVQRVKKPASH